METSKITCGYPCAEKESLLSQGQSQDKSRLVAPHLHSFCRTHVSHRSFHIRILITNLGVKVIHNYQHIMSRNLFCHSFLDCCRIGPSHLQMNRWSVRNIAQQFYCHASYKVVR